MPPRRGSLSRSRSRTRCALSHRRHATRPTPRPRAAVHLELPQSQRGVDAFRRVLESIAIADGAPRECIIAMRRAEDRDSTDFQLAMPWEALCAAVSKLAIHRRGAARVVELGAVAGAREPITDQSAYRELRNGTIPGAYLVTPPGVEACLRGEERAAEGDSGKESASAALPMTP